jgi:hypothetical protein
MEVMLLFAAGWLMSHAFGEKRDEYERSQDAHRAQYMQRLAKKHPNWSTARQNRYLQNAARRNALGHFAYLLRHGWSATFNDFVHGWNHAKTAHEEWKAEHPNDRPGRRQMFKLGWRDNARRRKEAAEAAAAAKRAAETIDAPAPAKPEPADATPEMQRDLLEFQLARKEKWLEDSIEAFEKAKDEGQIRPEDEAEHMANRARREQEIADLRKKLGKPAAEPTTTAKVLPLRGATSQAPGSTAGSTKGRSPVEFNYDATKAEMNNISEYVTGKLSVIEQIIADAIAGDMNKDPETMSNLAGLQEALANANAHATAVGNSMGKHASGQEYANTGHAASTDYLKSS